MANLIITIISIGLFAIAAIMGAYYAGTAFQQGQINANADAMINEAQQILIAARMWATNNNQPDISGMPYVSGQNGILTPVTSGVGITGIGALYSGKYLAVWPNLVGNVGGPIFTYPATFQGAGAAPILPANLPQSAIDVGCYSTNGYLGPITRYIFAYQNGNYVAYNFSVNGNYPAASNCNANNANWTTMPAKHPILQIAAAVNAKMNQIPSNATMTAQGVPTPNYGSSPIGTNWGIIYDTNGILQNNYCYIYTAFLTCIFGPS